MTCHRVFVFQKFSRGLRDITCLFSRDFYDGTIYSDIHGQWLSIELQRGGGNKETSNSFYRDLELGQQKIESKLEQKKTSGNLRFCFKVVADEI